MFHTYFINLGRFIICPNCCCFFFQGPFGRIPVKMQSKNGIDEDLHCINCQLLRDSEICILSFTLDVKKLCHLACQEITVL